MRAEDELVAFVDERNRVVGAVRRREMRAGNLPHRATYILVFNSRGGLYVQKRTQSKDVFPGYYDVAAGGVILAGESYEEGGLRELEEELGIRGVPLTRLFDFSYKDEAVKVWGAVAKDGTSVTWKLRNDVKWADGKPFTASDVVFTFQYITNPDVKSSSAGTYASVQSVDALDDYTVKVTFKQPTAAWYVPFVGSFGMIIPRHLFETYNGSNAQEAPNNLAAIGTGAFSVSEWRNEDVLIIGGNAVSTNKIIYEFNPYYRDPNKPFFSKVELRGGGDIKLAGQAGKEGAVDFIWNVALPEETLVDIESAGKSLVPRRLNAGAESFAKAPNTQRTRS